LYAITPAFTFVAVRQPEVLLRRDVAEHRGAVPADHRRTNRRRDVIVFGRDIGGQRPERVEGRFLATLELFLHVFFDEVHGTWPGHFVNSPAPWSHAIWFSSPCVFSSANCASSFASAMDPGRSPSPSENDTSYVRMISQISRSACR